MSMDESSSCGMQAVYIVMSWKMKKEKMSGRLKRRIIYFRTRTPE